MIGFNKFAARRIVHNWVASPTPLNPTLLRSACGRAYAFKSAIESATGRSRCAACEKKHPTVTGDANG